jgi:hypothetical protein
MTQGATAKRNEVISNTDSLGMPSDNKIMDERDSMRRWVETWKRAGPELEAIRRKEIESLDTRETLAALEGAFNYATRNVPPDPNSGLVEMQKWFAKLRK